ncbi:hypothetical protein ONZ51_g12035 [Trametes cubensis]|uniref:DUF6532 domain-containing protein n=1 Tax=Trametes cubensis TaxID=1111947 RepID=A0AAD7TJ13_9APHY|nr:hypothetical protein ONZ51_g12035 [Trametes cubensis]
MPQSKRRGPSQTQDEDDHAEPEPARRNTRPRKSATSADITTKDDDPPEQETSGRPEQASSQRAPRKSKTAALEKRIWTADAPKRKASQPKEPAREPDTDPEGQLFDTDEERPVQRPKTKRLAAAKYRAPIAESSDDEGGRTGARNSRMHTADASDNEMETRHASKARPKNPTPRQTQPERRSASTSTTSRSSASDQPHAAARKKLREQVRGGDDDSPESSSGESNGIEGSEDGESSESSSDDLCVKDGTVTEQKFLQEVPEWIASDKDNRLEQQTAQLSAHSSSTNRRQTSDEPPLSPSPSASETEQARPTQTRKKRSASHRTSDNEESTADTDTPETDQTRRRDPSSSHKIHVKKKKRIAFDTSDDSDDAQQRSVPKQPHTAINKGGAAERESREDSRGRHRDRNDGTEDHAVPGRKRSRADSEKAKPRWSDDDVPVKQRKQSKSKSPTRTSSAPTKKLKKRADRVNKKLDDDDIENGSGSEDERIDIVYKNGSKIGITEQRPRVKKTLNTAIFSCQADILLRNAFPDGTEKYNAIARNALVKCADELGYTTLVKRLKHDNDYALSLASIPVDRIPSFRSRIREVISGAIQSTYHLRPGDVAHVNWLQKGCRYIYPHDYKKDRIFGDEPFALPIFVDGLRAAYFRTPKSFGWRIVDKFTSSFPEKPEEKELPAAMVALVSTAVFAAIDDHRSNACEGSDFTTNSYSAAYKRNMDILLSLKERSLEAYHDIMHDLFKALCGSTTGAGARPGDDNDHLTFLQVPAKYRCH